MTAKSIKSMFVTLVSLLAVLGLLAGCGSAGAAKSLTATQAADHLSRSISLRNGVLSFVIPDDYTDARDWNILVYGSAKMGHSSMSVHLFEQENENQSWQAGQQYQIDLNGQAYQELYMDISLRSDGHVERQIDLLSVPEEDN